MTEQELHAWAGDQPVFLVFEPEAGDGNIGIDIDVAGWVEGHRETFRKPGVWFLIDKETSQPRLSVVCLEGDQFYYNRHHAGVIGSATASIVLHTIGKKRSDGSMVRLWLMPNGMVMGGEEGEVDIVSIKMITG